MQHNCTHFPDIYYRLLGTVGVLVWCQCECDALIIQMFWALNVAHRSKLEARCVGGQQTFLFRLNWSLHLHYNP